MVSPVGMMAAPTMTSAAQLAAQQQALVAQQQAQLAAARQRAAQAAAQAQATAAANAVIAQQAAAARAGLPTASQEVIAAQAQAAAQAAAAQELAARQAAEQQAAQIQPQSTLPPLSSTEELKAQVLAVQQSAQAAQQQIALQQEIANQQAAAVRQANEAALAGQRARELTSQPVIQPTALPTALPTPATTPGIEQVRQQAEAAAATQANTAATQNIFAQTQAQSAAQDQFIQQQAAAQAAQIAEARRQEEAARAAIAEQQRIVAPPAPVAPPASVPQVAPVVPTFGIITLPDGSVVDLGNVSQSLSGAPTGLFTGTTVPTPVAPPVAPVAPLGNTDYTIRQTPASALSMLGGLPVSLPAEVTAYLSSQPQIVSPFEGMPSLVGAQDIFGGRSYVTHSTAGPEKRRVGLMEMKQLAQTPGFDTTVRPEFLGETYLPFRPEGTDPNVVNDTKLWHQYYTDNKDYRKYLSADEQTELAWLDYRTGITDKNQFTSAVNQVRENFNLPQKVAFEDFEAHFSIGTKRKKYSDNPYQDLQDYGPAIGGYWNPENDPSETQQVLSNPFVQTAITAIGNALGGPLGAAIASTATTRATGADWSDALTAGAVSGTLAGIGALQEASQAAQMASQAATGGAAGAASGGLSLLGLNPQLTNALVQGAGTLAKGGDIKDALVSAGLGYAGAPGGMLSKTLGDLGLDVGQGVISKAVEGLSLADVAKFGYKSTEDFGSALGGLIQNMDLGTLEQTGLLGVLPQGLQDAVRKVEVSDLLASGVGGIDQGLAFNILNDINMPYNLKVGMLTGQVEIPQWMKDAYQAAKQGVQTAAEAVEGVVQPAARVVAEGAKTALEAAESVVQPVAQQVERVAGKAYDATEQAIQDAVSVITPASPGSMFNIPNVDLFASTQPIPEFNIQTPNVNLPDVNAPDVNMPNVNLPNVNVNIAGGGGGGQQGMFDKFSPYQFAGIRFNPRAPVVPNLQPRGQDPLSILLRG